MNDDLFNCVFLDELEREATGEQKEKQFWENLLNNMFYSHLSTYTGANFIKKVTGEKLKKKRCI